MNRELLRMPLWQFVTCNQAGGCFRLWSASQAIPRPPRPQLWAASLSHILLLRSRHAATFSLYGEAKCRLGATIRSRPHLPAPRCVWGWLFLGVSSVQGSPLSLTGMQACCSAEDVCVSPSSVEAATLCAEFQMDSGPQSCREVWCFWPSPWHTLVPRLGTEPTPQQ